jgi:hypothetical protein
MAHRNAFSMIKRSVILISLLGVGFSCTSARSPMDATLATTNSSIDQPSPRSSTVSHQAPDCHSGSREPIESKTHVFTLSEIEQPPGVKQVELTGSPLAISISPTNLWAILGAASSSGEYRLASVDLESLAVDLFVELESVGSIAVDESVWVTQIWKDSLYQIDAETGLLVEDIRMPTLSGGALGLTDPCFGPDNVAVSHGDVWVDGRGSVARIESGANVIASIVDSPNGETVKGGEIAVGFGTVWITSNGFDLWRIDPSNNSWDGGIPVAPVTGHAVDRLAIGKNYIWVSGGDFARDDQRNLTNTLSSTGSGVSLVDPFDGGILRTLHFEMSSVLVASDGIERAALWEQGVGLRLASENSELATDPILCSTAEASAMLLYDRFVWIALPEAGALWRLDLSETRESCA